MLNTNDFNEILSMQVHGETPSAWALMLAIKQGYRFHYTWNTKLGVSLNKEVLNITNKNSSLWERRGATWNGAYEILEKNLLCYVEIVRDEVRTITIHGYDPILVEEYYKYIVGCEKSIPVIADKTIVRFWHFDPQDGPTYYTKKLGTPDWPSLITNYAKNQQSALSDLLKYQAKDEESGRLILLRGTPGTGKCLGKDTPVLMCDGTVKMVQDVVVGDKLMGADSSPRTVLSTCSGEEELYKIIPVKGEPYTVNESHILTLFKYKKGLVDIPLTSWFQLPNTLKVRIKGVRTGVEFSEKDLTTVNSVTMPPYLLGLWLGDGTQHPDSGFDITNIDKEIISYLRLFAEKNGLRLFEHTKTTTKCSTWCAVGVQGKSNPLTQIIRSLNLYNNRHIPYNYLCTSRENRLDLLAGLLDTDGELTDNCFSITQKSKRLANDIVFLARSLGLAAYMKSTWKKAQTGPPREYWRVSISGDTDQIPVRVEYKKASKRKQIKNVLHTGITIEPQGIGEYYGFTLDGDGRFLLSDFTITHNSHFLRTLMQTWKSWCSFNYIIDVDKLFTYSSYMIEVFGTQDYSNDDDFDPDEPAEVKSKHNLIILEDCGELIAKDAKAQSGQSLSKMLNLADGILGQGSKCLILISTNEELKDLHNAVTRPGRCLANLEFPVLPANEALEWQEQHKVSNPVKKSMSLAELYDLLNKSLIKGTSESNTIGFTSR